MQVISKGRTPGTISFTFDDGVSKNFSDLLDILGKENIKATFFIIGESLKVASNLALAKEAHRRGHTLSNHTWTHPQITKIPVAQLEEELRKTEAALEEIRGPAGSCKFFRPPFGATNPSINDLLSKLGYTVFLWNIDTNDWDTKRSRDVLLNEYKKLFSSADPKKNSYISLQHDRRKDSVVLVPQIAQLARDKGFRIIPLEETVL
jgi:peptidoglycan/xylan/chitin deacetylase (PgdA/CDA1 family)